MGLIKSFVEFIREQGVAGLAVGFIMGGAISKLITSFINDILNPLIGLLIGKTAGLQTAYFSIGSSKVMWGDFVSGMIDFVLIAFVVYVIFKVLRLDKTVKKD